MSCIENFFSDTNTNSKFLRLGSLLLRRDFDCDLDVDSDPGISWQTRSGSEKDQALEEDGRADHADCDDDGDRHENVANDVYSTPYTSPQDTRQPIAPELHGTPSMNGDQDDEEDAYYSLDEGDMESESERELEDDPGGTSGREAAVREMERRRVLEAAGLVVSPPSSGPSPSCIIMDGAKAHEHVRVASAPALSAATRSKSGSGSGSSSVGRLLEFTGRRRRPAPAVPQRELAQLLTKNLPPIPTIDLPRTDTSLDAAFRPFDTVVSDKDIDVEQEPEEVIGGLAHIKTWSDGSVIRPDDAFERYETFKKMQASHGHGHSPRTLHRCATPASASRMSMSSFDTGSLAPTSPPRSPAASVTPSLREREREGGGGGGWNESRASQFFSFLGRHTRASTPDNAGKLVISGPLLHAPTPSVTPASLPSLFGEVGDPTRESSPAFGSSWASLVDRSALEGIPKEERRRQEAIFELISTETDYVRDLQLIVKVRGHTGCSLDVTDVDDRSFFIPV